MQQLAKPLDLSRSVSVLGLLVHGLVGLNGKRGCLVGHHVELQSGPERGNALPTMAKKRNGKNIL